MAPCYVREPARQDTVNALLAAMRTDPGLGRAASFGTCFIGRLKRRQQPRLSPAGSRRMSAGPTAAVLCAYWQRSAGSAKNITPTARQGSACGVEWIQVDPEHESTGKPAGATAGRKPTSGENVDTKTCRRADFLRQRDVVAARTHIDDPLASFGRVGQSISRSAQQNVLMLRRSVQCWPAARSVCDLVGIQIVACRSFHVRVPRIIFLSFFEFVFRDENIRYGDGYDQKSTGAQ